MLAGFVPPPPPPQPLLPATPTIIKASATGPITGRVVVAVGIRTTRVSLRCWIPKIPAYQPQWTMDWSGGANHTTFTLDNLWADNTVHCQAWAANGVRVGAYSNEVTFVTPPIDWSKPLPLPALSLSG